MRPSTMLERLRPYLPILFAVIVAAFGGSGLAIVVVDDDPATPDRTIATVNTGGQATIEAPGPDRVVTPFDGADQDTAPDDGLVEAPEPAVETALENVEEGADRRDTAADRAKIHDALEENRRELDPLPLGGAFESVPGCRTRLLAGDSSSRNGIRPVWLTWHYAVIPNRTGFGDLDLLFSIFANPARDASSHFGLDAEGHCYYMVPIERKAWTAVGANSLSISVEIIAMGNEPDLCPAACMDQARRIARFVQSKAGIPIRRGHVNPSNLCAPGSAGQITHDDHKGCGGGHVDIRPFSIDAFARDLAAGGGAALSELERKLVAAVRKPAGTGHSRRYWCGRLSAQIAWLERSSKVPRRDARIRILRRIRRATCPVAHAAG